jgi:hypothetical protein
MDVMQSYVFKAICRVVQACLAFLSLRDSDYVKTPERASVWCCEGGLGYIQRLSGRYGPEFSRINGRLRFS